MKILVCENEIYDISDFKKIEVNYVDEMLEKNDIVAIEIDSLDEVFYYEDLTYSKNLESRVANLIARSIASNEVTDLDEIMEGFYKWVYTIN